MALDTCGYSKVEIREVWKPGRIPRHEDTELKQAAWPQVPVGKHSAI